MSAGAASLGPGQAPGAARQDCPFGACSRVLLLRPVSPPGFGAELCTVLIEATSQGALAELGSRGCGCPALGQSGARCDALGWDVERAALPGCPWPWLFPCYCVLKSSCRVASCIGTSNRTPLVAPLSTLPRPQQFKSQWHMTTYRIFYGMFELFGKKMTIWLLGRADSFQLQGDICPQGVLGLHSSAGWQGLPGFPFAGRCCSGLFEFFFFFR